MNTKIAATRVSLSLVSLGLGRYVLASALSIGVLLCLFADYFDEKRVTELAVMMVLGLGAIVSGRSGQALPSGRVIGFSTACFFLLGIASSLRSYSPAMGFVEVSMFLMFLMLATMVANEVARDRLGATRRILFILGVGCALYAFTVLVGYVAAMTMPAHFSVHDFTPGFANYRGLNYAQTVLLPVLALLCLPGFSSPRLRPVWYAVGALWWTILFATSARGAAIGLLAGVIGALVLYRGRAGAFLRALGASAAAGVAVYVILCHLIPSLLGIDGLGDLGRTVQRSMDDPTSLRVPLWTLAAELVKSAPLLGVGPMHYAHFSGGLDTAAGPHNLTLQIASEWGIPALLCLMVAVAAGCLKLLARARSVMPGDATGQAAYSAWMVIAIAVLVDAQVGGTMSAPFSQLTITLFIGLAAGWVVAPAAAPSRARTLAGSALFVAAMAGIAIGAAPGIERWYYDLPLTRHEQEINRFGRHPRLWAVGHF